MMEHPPVVSLRIRQFECTRMDGIVMQRSQATSAEMRQTAYQQQQQQQQFVTVDHVEHEAPTSSQHAVSTAMTSGPGQIQQQQQLGVERSSNAPSSSSSAARVASSAASQTSSHHQPAPATNTGKRSMAISLYQCQPSADIICGHPPSYAYSPTAHSIPQLMTFLNQNWLTKKMFAPIWSFLRFVVFEL